LYDDIKEDNDKKKTYIQELAGKYQSIIEDLKSQLASTSNNDQHYQENLKLNTDELNSKIDQLTRENAQLQTEIEILKLQPSSDLERERELWNTEKTIIETRIREKLLLDFRTKEGILKK
jgi:predicted RNase H-like nuclease (RuvC/YqgF family)